MNEDEIKNKWAGSRWRKWDLHVHTPKTFLNNSKYSNISIDQFIDEIHDSGITAVGLTNYFKFHDSELEEIKEELDKKGINVFPNVELRISDKNKKNDYIHIHILFSNNVSIKKIKKFLSAIKTDIDEEPCQDLEEHKMKKALVRRTELEKQFKKNTPLKHLQDYLVISCVSGYGAIRPDIDDKSRGMDIPIKIAKMSDLFFGNSKDRKFYLNLKRYPGAKAKPVLSCSDAHRLEDIGKKFTWIKAAPTFDGLKQVLYEPEARICIQERNPDESKSERLIINSATYKNSNGKEEKVYFSKHLNSIIGKRGSGKSTLLKNLAKNTDNDEFKKRGVKNMCKLTDFKVIWGDNQINNGTTESKKSIIYIPQAFLSALAYENGECKKERDDFLTTLLKKNESFAKAVKDCANFVSQNKVYIEQLIQKALNIHKDIIEKRAHLKKKGNIAEIKKDIKKRNEEIKKYEKTKIFATEIKKYFHKEKIIHENEVELNILKKDKNILTIIIEEDINPSIFVQNLDYLSPSSRSYIYDKLHKKTKEYLKNIINKKLEEINQEILQLNESLTKKKKEIHRIKPQIENNKAIKDLSMEITEYQEKIDLINKLLNEKENLEKEMKKTICNLAEAYISFEMQQNTFYKMVTFEEKWSFLKINFTVTHNDQKLKEFVEKKITKRNMDDNIKFNSIIDKLFQDNPDKIPKQSLEHIITWLIDEKIKTKSKDGDIETVLSVLLRNRFQIDYSNSIMTNDKSQTHFKNMTGGQKAIVFLELIFRFEKEKYPLLFDQPEDDLDVSGVSTDLVNFIISEKNERQVIIATHNANLVVSTDAENIIIANDQNFGNSDYYNFIYETDSLESKKCRENIIEILEGGREAFEKRKLKLDPP